MHPTQSIVLTMDHGGCNLIAQSRVIVDHTEPNPNFRIRTDTNHTRMLCSQQSSLVNGVQNTPLVINPPVSSTGGRKWLPESYWYFSYSKDLHSGDCWKDPNLGRAPKQSLLLRINPTHDKCGDLGCVLRYMHKDIWYILEEEVIGIGATITWK